MVWSVKNDVVGMRIPEPRRLPSVAARIRIPRGDTFASEDLPFFGAGKYVLSEVWPLSMMSGLPVWVFIRLALTVQ